MVDFTSLLTKLKSLDIDIKQKVQGLKQKLSEPIGDGIRSSYSIISIAGETLALSETGLDPTEKTFHNKDDFKRLYVPENIQNDQSALEEILLRMFPLTSAQSQEKQENIYPPEDEEEFTLVRESLHYRISLLRDEILKDTSNSVDIREKLSRFDRLNKLIDSLESKFKKNKTKTYFAITTMSDATPTQEPKIEMDDDTVDDLLRKFGLILLQSQHQLPGFRFPVSPGQIVRQVQSTLLPDEEEFIEEATKEGPVQQSISDVLDPNEKEKRILNTLKTAIKTKLEPLLESIQFDHASDLDLSIDDEDKPFEESLEGLLQTLFRLINELEDDMTSASELQDTMDSFIETLTNEKKDCQRQLALLQAELAKTQKSEGEGKSKETSDRKAFEAGAKKLRKEIDDKTAQIRILQDQLTKSKEQLVQQEGAAQAVGTLTPEIERLRNELTAKDKTIAELEAKESELEPLRQRINELEGKETLTAKEQQSLALAETQVERLSQEKTTLEGQLQEFSDQFEELQGLVDRIPSSLPKEGISPFEVLKQRIYTALPSAFRIPSILEIESDQKTYTCKFLEALLQIVQRYLDSADGQELEGRLTEQLDDLYTSSPIHGVVNTLLLSLNYANATSTSEVDFGTLAENQQLKDADLSTKADGVFFGAQEELRDVVQPLSVRLAGNGLPSYPVLFLAYLLALRDWVNCIDLSSRPGKCPIPERLLRPTLKCQ